MGHRTQGGIGQGNVLLEENGSPAENGEEGINYEFLKVDFFAIL
jgi:hypothetical protein